MVTYVVIKTDLTAGPIKRVLCIRGYLRRADLNYFFYCTSIPAFVVNKQIPGAGLQVIQRLQCALNNFNQ